MIVECEFTNASDLKRERVVFLTDMQLMTNGQRPFRVFWEYDHLRKRTSATLTLMHLHRAMHDPEFRVQMETDTLIMAKWPLDQRACWFLMFHHEQCLMARILRIQAAVRRWVMHRRLCVDRIFSKAAAANRILLSAGQLNQDTVDMILLYSMRPNGPSNHHNNFTVWSKSECDGQVFD